MTNERMNVRAVSTRLRKLFVLGMSDLVSLGRRFVRRGFIRRVYTEVPYKVSPPNLGRNFAIALLRSIPSACADPTEIRAP